MDAIGDALATALRRISEVVGEQAGRGLGREVVGLVPGRPESEDVEIGIDSRCDAIFIESLQDTGVTVRVYSEHGEDLVGSGEPARQTVARLAGGRAVEGHQRVGNSRRPDE